MNRWPIRILLVLMTSAWIGCAPGPGAWNGIVTYEGRPVTVGTITALGADRIPRGARIGPDGRFQLQDLPPGPIQVAIESPDPSSGLLMPEGDGGSPAPAVPAGWRLLPDKYSRFDTSGLSFEIQAGANSHSIELK